MTSFCAASQRDQKLLRSPKPSAEMDSEPGLRGVLGAFPASPGLPSPWVKRPPPQKARSQPEVFVGQACCPPPLPSPRVLALSYLG